MSVNGRLLHSGHAWIELKRLHMSRIGSWLVFQFPRRPVSPRVNPFLFFKSSVVISSSTFNDVLSLSSRWKESRWIWSRPTVNLGVETEHRNVETPRWIIYEASVTRWAENRGRRSGFDLSRSRILLSFFSRTRCSNVTDSIEYRE